MPSIGEATSTVLKVPRQLLLIDTCALFDILRAPARGRSGDVDASVLVRSSAEQKNSYVLASSVVRTEFGRNCGRVQTEATAFIEQWEKNTKEIRSTLSAIGMAIDLPMVPSPSPLVDGLLKVAEDINNLSIHIDGDIQTNNKALTRTLAKNPPSVRGGTPADSVLVEEYLEIATRLRDCGFSFPIVLLSSNTRDFCDDTGRRLHPNLQAEFDPVRIDYAKCWGEAARFLGLFQRIPGEAALSSLTPI